MKIFTKNKEHHCYTNKNKTKLIQKKNFFLRKYELFLLSYVFVMQHFCTHKKKEMNYIHNQTTFLTA